MKEKHLTSLSATYTLFHITYSFSSVFFSPYIYLSTLPPIFPLTSSFFHQTQFNLQNQMYRLISTLSHTCTTLHQPISILKTSLHLRIYLLPPSTTFHTSNFKGSAIQLIIVHIPLFPLMMSHCSLHLNAIPTLEA